VSTVRGLGSVKRSLNNIFQHYLRPREEDHVDNDKTPYDALFGKKIVRKIKEKGSYVEKLTFPEFRDKVQW
jgi:hypothetical protein